MANYTKKRKTNVRKQDSSKDDTKVYSKGSQKTCKPGEKALANDPEWYLAYPELVESTCKLVTGYPLGINMNLGSTSDPYILAHTAFAMRLNYIHGIGPTEKETDPVNLSATRIYSYVRHANSGHSNYEKTDLMLYFLAVTECYNMIAYAERAYGLCFMYNSQNRMLPARMLTAAGWDYDDITNNLNLLRTYINTAIARINSLYVPTELRAAKRWWWMNSNVFVDSQSPKAYCYIYTPMVYRTYEELNSNKMGYLKANEIPATMTVSDWNIAMRRMLNKLFASEDIGIISGDILKAYGNDVFTLSPLEEFHNVQFIYSEEVLTQINNTRLCPFKPIDLDITQVSTLKGANLVYLPALEVSDIEAFERAHGAGWFLNVQGEQHMPIDNLVASRNTWTIWGNDGTNKVWLGSGSETIVSEVIYLASSEVSVYASDVSGISVTTVLYHTQFDFAPMLASIDVSNPKQVVVVAGGSRYDTIIPVDATTLGRMHDTALMSLFSATV